MSKFKGVLITALLGFRRTVFSTRGIVFILMCAFFVSFQTEGLRELADKYNTRMEAVFLPYLHSDGLYQMLFGILCIYFYSDAPFQSRSMVYSVMRIGKKKWVWANILKVFFLALHIMVFEVAISVLINLGNIKIDNTWDALWNTISVSWFNDGVLFSRNVIISFTPFQATFRVVTMGVLVVGMIGLIQYCFSLIFGKRIAIAVNGIICILPLLAVYTRYPYLYYISPISWMGIIEHNAGYRFHRPALIFMYMTALILDVVMIIILQKVTSRKDMNITEE